MSRFPDIVIVGGGVVGAACARELAEAGYQVRLLERGGEAGEAWRASAGLLVSQIEVPQEDPLFAFGVAGREFYAEAALLLRDSTGIDIGLSREGIYQLARTKSEAATLQARIVWQRAQGEPADWLGSDELARVLPWLAPAKGALYAPRDGYVHPVRLVEALRADAIRLGAALVEDEAVALQHERGVVTGVRGRSAHAAGAVLLAAGAWSGRIQGLPRPLSVEPVRGELVAYKSPGRIPPVFGGHCYLLPRGDSVIAGSTMAYAGFAPEVTEAGVRAIRERAEALFPALAERPPVAAWAGLRPGSPDGRPVVGADPEMQGLWYATGHGRNGILYAGVTARLVAHLMKGGSFPKEAAPLRPERFWCW